MRLNVKVHPNSKKDQITDGQPLVVRVTDSPESGKANRKVIKLLSKHFKARVRIISGLRNREKTIEVEE